MRHRAAPRCHRETVLIAHPTVLIAVLFLSGRAHALEKKTEQTCVLLCLDTLRLRTIPANHADKFDWEEWRQRTMLGSLWVPFDLHLDSLPA